LKPEQPFFPQLHLIDSSSATLCKHYLHTTTSVLWSRSHNEQYNFGEAREEYSDELWLRPPF
jgi:hypothetical protein